MSYNLDAQVFETQIVIENSTQPAGVTSGSIINKGSLSTFDTYVTGHTVVNNVRITPNLNDIIFEQQSALANNQNSFVDITDFSFDDSICNSFKAMINVTVSDTDSKHAVWEINGLYKPSGWVITSSFTGDITGVQFSIVNKEGGIGQIQYLNTNTSGTTVIRYRASTTAPPGSTPLGVSTGVISNTSGPFIANNLVYANTSDTLATTDIVYNSNVLRIGGASRIVAENGTVFTNFSNGGALTSMGDASVAKKMIVGQKIGIATTAPGYTLDVAGDINFTGTFYKNNSVYSGSEIWNTNGNDVFYTMGNLGVGTSSPSKTLDVAGTARITTGLTTGTIYASNVTATNVSTGGLNASGTSALVNLTATNASVGVLVASTGITAASAQITNANITTASVGTLVNTNAVATNVSVGTLNVTGITASNINFTGNLYQNGSVYISSQWLSESGGALSYTTGNVAMDNSRITNANVTTASIGTLVNTNSIATNISTGTIVASTGITAASAQFTNANITTASVGTLIGTDLVSTNISTGTINLSTGITAASAKITNVNATTISAGTLIGTTITGANLSLSGDLVIGGTLTTVNITTTNVVDTNITSGSINVTSLATINNATVTTATVSTLLTTDVSAGSINVSTGITAGSAKITNLSSTNSSIGSFVSGSGTVGGHLVPSSNITYDLGSATQRWRDLYLSGNTIHLGDKQLSLSGDTFQLENISVIGTREATSTTSASIVVAGGVGISGKLRVAGTSYITNAEITSVTAANIVVPGFINTQTNTINTTTIQPNNIGANKVSGLHYWTNNNNNTISDTTYVNWGPVFDEYNVNQVKGISNISGGDLSVQIRITGTAENDDSNNDITGTFYIANSSGNLISTIYEYTVDNATPGGPPLFTSTPGSLAIDTGYITVTIPQGGSIQSKDNGANVNSADLGIQNPYVYINVVNLQTNIPTIISTNTTVTNITSGSAKIINANVGSATVGSANITSATVATLLNTNTVSTNVSAATLNLSTGITTGSFNASGLSVLSNVTATNTSVGGLNASGLSVLANATATNVSTGGFNASGLSVLVNATATNASVGVLIASTGITTGTINASGLSVLSNVTATNASVGGLNASGLSVLANATATNASVGVLIASTGITTGSFNASGLSVLSNATATNASVGGLNASGLSVLANATATNASVGVLIASTGITTAALLNTGLISTANLASTTATIPNIVVTTISAGTLSASTITGANLSLSGNLIVGGTLTTVNITSTNILNTNISIGTIVATGLSSLQNVTATNISSATLNLSTGITAASAQITNANVTTSTIATARITTNLISLGNSNTIGNIFTTGGNVGIATASPGSSLHVAGSIPVSPVGGGVHMGIDPSTYAVIQLNSTAGSYIDFGTSGGDYQSRIIAGSTGNLSISTNGASNNGFVGINTATPAYTLDVSGTGRFTGKLTITGSNGATGFDTATNDQYADMRVIRNSSSSLDKDMYIQNGAGATSTLHLFSNNSETMTIKSGNVGIAITSPAYTLDVSGTGRFTSALLAIGNSNTVGNIFTTGGNVGISTTAPSGMLHLNNAALFTSTGNLTCTGDIISFGSLSDRRLKKNIETIETLKALEIVSRLRAVTFDWREDIFNEEKRNTSDIGFIAQEVEALVPEAVSEYTQIESGEVYKNIKHERLVPYLLSAIQYLLSKQD